MASAPSDGSEPGSVVVNGYTLDPDAVAAQLKLSEELLDFAEEFGNLQHLETAAFDGGLRDVDALLAQIKGVLDASVHNDPDALRSIAQASLALKSSLTAGLRDLAASIMALSKRADSDGLFIHDLDVASGSVRVAEPDLSTAAAVASTAVPSVAGPSESAGVLASGSGMLPTLGGAMATLSERDLQPAILDWVTRLGKPALLRAYLAETGGGTSSTAAATLSACDPSGDASTEAFDAAEAALANGDPRPALLWIRSAVAHRAATRDAAAKGRLAAPLSTAASSSTRAPGATPAGAAGAASHAAAASTAVIPDPVASATGNVAAALAGAAASSICSASAAAAAHTVPLPPRFYPGLPPVQALVLRSASVGPAPSCSSSSLTSLPSQSSAAASAALQGEVGDTGIGVAGDGGVAGVVEPAVFALVALRFLRLLTSAEDDDVAGVDAHDTPSGASTTTTTATATSSSTSSAMAAEDDAGGFQSPLASVASSAHSTPSPLTALRTPPPAGPARALRFAAESFPTLPPSYAESLGRLLLLAVCHESAAAIAQAPGLAPSAAAASAAAPGVSSAVGDMGASAATATSPLTREVVAAFLIARPRQRRPQRHIHAGGGGGGQGGDGYSITDLVPSTHAVAAAATAFRAAAFRLRGLSLWSPLHACAALARVAVPALHGYNTRLAQIDGSAGGGNGVAGAGGGDVRKAGRQGQAPARTGAGGGGGGGGELQQLLAQLPAQSPAAQALQAAIALPAASADLPASAAEGVGSGGIGSVGTGVVSGGGMGGAGSGSGGVAATGLAELPSATGGGGVITAAFTEDAMVVDVDVASVRGVDALRHSVFVCPVTKQLAGLGDNPPVLLRCGHAIALEALARITTTIRNPRGAIPAASLQGPPETGWAGRVVEGVRFKCPTCPMEQTAAETMVLRL